MLAVEVVVDMRDTEVEVVSTVVRVIAEDEVVSFVRDVAGIRVVGVFGVVDVDTCVVEGN